MNKPYFTILMPHDNPILILFLFYLLSRRKTDHNNSLDSLDKRSCCVGKSRLYVLSVWSSDTEWKYDNASQSLLIYLYDTNQHIYAYRSVIAGCRLVVRLVMLMFVHDFRRELIAKSSMNHRSAILVRVITVTQMLFRLLINSCQIRISRQVAFLLS